MLGSNASEGIPKYIQLATIIRDKILRQEYKAGEQIPSEVELCGAYQVSRITVREAVNKLVQENYLNRVQGKGTYVVHPKLRRNIAKVYSFSSDMRHLGLEPSSRVLALAVEEVEGEMAEKLRLPADNRRVTRISRVRMANGVPILTETTLIPEHLCGGLVGRDLEGSLYQILTEEYRLMPHHAEETYEAVIMGQRDAELLQCESSAPQPAFAIECIVYLESGLPIEYSRSVGRGDMVTLTNHMVADKADFQRVVGLASSSNSQQ